MTNQLHGRPLDEAVAAILGWSGTMAGSTSKMWTRGGDYAALRAYSTDPATQAEKLAWLDRQHCYLEIKANCIHHEWSGHPRRVFVSLICLKAPHVTECLGKGAGMTIDEALCRLILAVAKAEDSKS